MRENTDGVCRKCGGAMVPGQAMGQTFHTGREGTCSPGGPGRLVDCLKCDSCGWSVTAGVPVAQTPLVRAYLEVSDAHTEWLTKDVPGERFIGLHRAFKARLAAIDAAGVKGPEHG